MSDSIPHWSSDRYWTDALESYSRLRENAPDKVEIDLAKIESFIYDGDSPAYKLVDAMCSVMEHEGWDGHKGAPRLVLALIAKLVKRSESA